MFEGFSSGKLVYLTAAVVSVCAVVLVVTLSVIVCWVVLYCKHAKVRARKGAPKEKVSGALSTISTETKPRHARTYHEQSFKPNECLDASGIFIFGVSGMPNTQTRETLT